MDRWQGKVAIVTGASSGIGAAIAEDLIKAGLIVLALARREMRLMENQAKLPESLRDNYHSFKCDVSNEEEVQCVFSWIDSTFKGAHILVNNAGIARIGTQLTDADNTEDIRDVVKTNVMGTMYCVRETFNLMKKWNIDGHIVIVNSVLGHSIPMMPNVHFNIYPATKYAITAMVETYRQEFANAGTKVKVTSISPGAVETEAIPNLEEQKQAGVVFLSPKDVSNAILYILGTPSHVQIHELIIRPLGESVTTS